MFGVWLRRCTETESETETACTAFERIARAMGNSYFAKRHLNALNGFPNSEASRLAIQLKKGKTDSDVRCSLLESWFGCPNSEASSWDKRGSIRGFLIYLMAVPIIQIALIPAALEIKEFLYKSHANCRLNTASMHGQYIDQFWKCVFLPYIWV